MKKNILILGCKNYPAFSSPIVISGGMEVYVWELIKHLKDVFDFTVIAGRSKSDDKSVKVISVPIFGGFAWQPISLVFFSFFICLGLIIKRKKIDLINAQTPLSGLIGFVFKKLFGIPYIVSVHIFASTKEHVGRLAGVYGVIEKLVLNNADKVICAGYKLQEHLTSRYKLHPDHFVVIHPGMDQVKNDKVAVNNTFKKVLDDGSFKMLFLGRLVDENGIMDLLEAVKYLKDKPVKLLIAGNGNLEAAINGYIQKEQLQSKVKLLGIVRGKDKISLLQNVNLAVRLSYHEVFPVAYLEAITFGIPVVATPVGDTEYLAERTNAISIVPLNDSRKAADVIEEMIIADGLSPKVIKKCEAFIQGINWKTQAEKTACMFNKILKENIL
jgi:glycosyltransferase involved in cell wall biosynthesis